jgi:predicted dehydrogenase
MKCLLIGFGNIGKIHSKYLEKKNIAWDWTDKNLGSSVQNINYNDYTHIFILTPEKTHYEVYKKIKRSGYQGFLFVEKPAVVNSRDFDIFEDKNVFVGLVERYNPAIQTLQKFCNPSKIINIDFSRCCVADHSSSASLLEDLGIHDLDLFLQITKLDKLNLLNVESYKNGKTCILTIEDPVLARFIWSKDTYFKERKITVRQDDCTFEVDLQEQTVVKHYYHQGKIVSESLFVEKSSPIANEQDSFFLNENQNGLMQSHKLLVKVNEANL